MLRHLGPVLALVFTACASHPVQLRAALIESANVDAKAALAGEQRIDLTSVPSRTLAVLPFTASGDSSITPLRFGLPALLMSDLSVAPQLRLVERLQTDALLRELQLVETGIVDRATGPRVGRLVGARRLLLGDIVALPSGTLQLSTRIVDVSAGSIQELASATTPLDRILDAEKALAFQLFEQLGITLTPAQRARIEQRQTSQLAALVAYSKGVEAEARGDARGAQAGYLEATRLDPGFGAAARSARSSTTAFATNRGSSLERVAAQGTMALNPALPGRLPETADAPLATGVAIAISFIVRVVP